MPVSWRNRAGLGALFVGLIGLFVRPTISHVSNDVPANLGDPLFLAWTMRAVGHQLVHNPLHLLDGNILWPHDLTIAYADPMVSFAPLFNAWHALTNGWAPALNLTIFSLMLLNLAATFAFAKWLTGRSDAALVAAVAFSFNAYVFGHWGHVQLQTLGMFPLGFLLLGKLLEDRSTKTALLFGVVSAVMCAGALYYAVAYAVVAAVVLGGYLALSRGRPGPGFWRSLLIAGALGGVLVAPVAVGYLNVQDLPGLKRPLVPGWGLNATDFLHPAERSYVYGGLQPPKSLDTPWEHRFFPGFLVMGLAGVGTVAMVRRTRHRDHETPPPERRRFLWLLLAGCGVATVLALGPDIGGFPGPFRFFHAYVPAFGGMRVTARLAVVAILAIALLAAVGFAALTQRARRARPWLVAGALAITAVELAAPLSWAPLDVSDARLAPYRALAKQAPGAVIELPMPDLREQPDAWAFVEAPRMVYSTLDWHPRVNGYTSFVPPDYLETVERVADFPSEDAIRRLRELDVRYVILHLDHENGFPAYSDAAASEIIGRLPIGWRSRRHGSAWVLTSPGR